MPSLTLGHLLVEPFQSFAFMRRALAGCVALSLGAAPVGVFLVLRRLALTGDAMAHAILPGVALAYLVAGLSLPAMSLGGLAAGLAVALLSGAVARWTALREDASLAAFYLISLSLGVILVSAQGSQVDLLHLLFGNVLALDDAALLLLAGIATATLVALALLWRGLVLECLDPRFLASVSGLGPALHASFLILVVLNLVAGFQALGTLMAVGLMILPAVTARFWATGLVGMVMAATATALLASAVGLLASFHLDLPTGPTIVLCAGVAYLLSLGLGPVGSLLAWSRLARHREAPAA